MVKRILITFLLGFITAVGIKLVIPVDIKDVGVVIIGLLSYLFWFIVLRILSKLSRK